MQERKCPKFKSEFFEFRQNSPLTEWDKKEQKKVEKLKQIESRLEWIKISVLLRQALHHSKI